MKSGMKTPGFAYPGGKVHLREWLVGMMPKEGDTYIEPFAGRGNVFWLAARRLKYAKWVLNDPHTFRFFHALADVDVSDIPFKFTTGMASTLTRAAVNGDTLALVMEPYTAFSGGQKHRTSARHCAGFSHKNFTQTVANAKRILTWRRPKITSADWKISIVNTTSESFVYLDPPYDNADAGYAINTVNHEELLRTLIHAKYRWLISGFATNVYTSLLGEPFDQQEQPLWMAGVTDKKECPTRVECVWRNY